MEEKKIKKKKLTLSVSSKKTHSVPHYAHSKQKTSVVIEKKTPRKWGEKKFQLRDNNFNKSKSTGNFFPVKLLSLKILPDHMVNCYPFFRMSGGASCPSTH